MTLEEFERVTEHAERMIHRCEPREAEYWRGYRRGIRRYFDGKADGSAEDHFTLINLAVHGCEDEYAAAYARGYHDGFSGKEPGFRD